MKNFVGSYGMSLAGITGKQLVVASILVLCGLLAPIKSNAQCATASQPVILKTFGSGTTRYSGTVPDDYNFSTSYIQETGVGNAAPNDGLFGFVNAIPDPWNVWHEDATDHTGDPGGYMMLVNADFTPGEFYRDTIHQLCPGVDYEFFSWIANIDLASLGSRIRPDVKFEIRDAADGSLIAD